MEVIILVMIGKVDGNDFIVIKVSDEPLPLTPKEKQIKDVAGKARELMTPRLLGASDEAIRRCYEEKSTLHEYMTEKSEAGVKKTRDTGNYVMMIALGGFTNEWSRVRISDTGIAIRIRI